MQYFELMWFTFSVTVHPLGFYRILSSLSLTVPSQKCRSFGNVATGCFVGRGVALRQHLLRLASVPNLGRAYAALCSHSLLCAHPCIVMPTGKSSSGRGLVQLPRGVPSVQHTASLGTLTAPTPARPAAGIRGKAGPRRGRKDSLT